jgi:hypothetical protein
MTLPDIIDRLDEILELLAARKDHGHSGLSEARRKKVERSVKALRDEISRSDD